jgi:hypothetical protein
MKTIKKHLYIQLFMGLLIFGYTISSKAQDTQPRYRVWGKITDGRTKKGIKKVPFRVMPFNRELEADRKGQFLLNMPEGNYSLIIDYYPFDKREIKLNVKSDTTLLMELHSPFGSQYIEEVEIISSKPVINEPAGMEEIDNKRFKTLPAMIGERDILKAFALKSGVTSSNEGAADMQVRGGLHGQNLYLLDGIPLYSTEHFFGMLSVYNPTTIKSAKLYKSEFPVEYGGKISSILNVISEDANTERVRAEAEISLLSSKAVLNIPVIKDKLALSVSGRISNYSLLDLASNSAFFKTDGSKFEFHFGDIGANLLWKISAKDKLKLNLFSNSDGIGVASTNKVGDTDKFWIKNRQMNMGIHWEKTISAKAGNELFAYTDNYGFDYGNSSENSLTNKYQIVQVVTGISSVGLTDKFRYHLSDNLSFNSGASIKIYRFSPLRINQNDTNAVAIKADELIRQTEAVAYAGNEYQITEKQSITTGLRFSSIGNADKTYTDIEPRIAYHGIFKNDYAISASVDRMTQPIHRVANPGIGFPFEMFYPSDALLSPEKSWIFSLGGAKDIAWNKNKFSIKADAWYKSMQNLVEFQDGYDALFSTLFSSQNVYLKQTNFLTQGKGKAYGIDFSADYSVRNWTLTADYTLMQATDQFDKLNNGRPFAASTDIRHSLSLTAQVRLTPTWSFSATWQYHSGKPITIPTYIYKSPTTNGTIFDYKDYDGAAFQRVITERNNYRMKPFHKLDISFTHNYKLFKKFNGSFSLGVYNVYNRANPYLYFIYSKENSDGTFSPELKSMSFFTILPSFSWSVKF